MIVLIAGVKYVKNRLTNQQKYKLKAVAKANVFTVVALMAMAMLFTAAELNWLEKYIAIPGFKTIAIISVAFSYGSIGCLGTLVIYINKVNEKMEQLINTEVRLNTMQKQYYEQLLKREEDTKRYRHDMIKHMVCLDGYAKENDLTVVQKYIGDMLEMLTSTPKKRFVTGNNTLDILTNYYVDKLNDSVQIELSGYLTVEMNEMKLCTIYGNILQNAVEELLQCETGAWLNIKLSEGKQYFQICVENSLSGAKEKKRVDTSLKFHGIGLKNVKDTVQELGGIMEHAKTDHSFRMVVSLPIQTAVNHVK